MTTEEEKEEYSYELKIPLERVAVLIGKKGEIKREIESLTKTHIGVDSKEGDIIITGEDAIKLFAAKEIVHAIGRGFNPDVARMLINQDYGFEIISISDYTKTKNDLKRLKGRIIGQEGKARRVLEELTDAHVCVYGKTVGIIGDITGVAVARKAVESLLSGSPHRNVYKWLEKQKSHSIKKELLGVE